MTANNRFAWITQALHRVRDSFASLFLTLEVRESPGLTVNSETTPRLFSLRNELSEYVEFLERSDGAEYEARIFGPAYNLGVRFFPSQEVEERLDESMTSSDLKDIVIFGSYNYDLGIRISTGEVLDMFEWQEVVIARSFEDFLRRCFEDAEALRSPFRYWRRQDDEFGALLKMRDCGTMSGKIAEGNLILATFGLTIDSARPTVLAALDTFLINDESAASLSLAISQATGLHPKRSP